MKLILSLIFLLYCVEIFSQGPTILQQRCLGGSRSEAISYKLKAQVTKDSGFIVISSTNSEDGDVMGLHTNGSPNPPNDIWLIKLSKYGGIQWQKCLGGSREDYGSAVDTGRNNTYFIAGEVYSNDGDVSGHHNINGPDGWVAKLDSNGNILWRKCIGGTKSEDIRSVRSTPDGGCLVVGITYSNDGDVSGNHNTSGTIPDGWVVKMNAVGNIEWSRCYGSTKSDEFNDGVITSDGKYIIAGTTNGGDGDVSGNHMGLAPDIFDGWVLKLETNGSIIWKNCYGGNYNDFFNSVRQAPDGGYIFQGSETSMCCDQVAGGNNGTSVDAWLLKSDAAGNFIWGRSYGGIYEEGYYGTVAVQNDGYTFCVASQFNNGDVQGAAYQQTNIWAVKVSFTGSLIWQRVLGGDKDDVPRDILSDFTGQPVVFGKTNSNNGDVKHFHAPSITGNDVSDIWLVKFTNYNTIKLNGFADFNSNNIKDSGEPFFLDYKAELYKNNLLQETDFSYGDTLQIFVDTGVYNVLPISYSAYYTPVPASVPANFTSFFNTLNANVSFRPAGSFNDLSIRIINITGNRRAGRTNSYRIFYKNIGTTTITTPSIDFIKDTRTSYISSSVPPASIINDTIKYTFIQIPPLDSGFVDITLRNSTALLFNDTLTFNGSIFPMVSDFTPADNQYQLKEIISGSYDPNDKTDNHGGSITRSQVLNGEYLNYTIRFQNTGNDTAFFISVKDTLSSKYDLASLQMVTASHRYLFEFAGNVCNWNFYDINLVDSNHNEAASHGFICFRIKAKNTIMEGDTIKNSTSIYFDYNPPVKTNISNTIVKATTITSVTQINAGSLVKMFPNPVINGSFFIKSKERLKGNIYAEIFNATGVRLEKFFLGKDLYDFTKELNISRMPGGVYIVIIRSDNKTLSNKLVKTP